jgi:hypothetical protein
MPPIGRITERVNMLQKTCQAFLAEQQRRHFHNLKIAPDYKAKQEYANTNLGFAGPHCVRPGLLGEEPYRNAWEVLKPLRFGQAEIQGFLDDIGVFAHLPREMFEEVEFFTAAMINRAFEKGGPQYKIELNLPGRPPVYMPEFDEDLNRVPRNPLPWCTSDESLEKLMSYYRTNLLLRYIGNVHSQGRLVLNGYLGAYFAAEARGGEVVLNGECGYRPCWLLNGAVVRINGIAGHHLLSDAKVGKVYVNDGIVNGQKITGEVRRLAEVHGMPIHLNERMIWYSEENPPRHYSFDPPGQKN